MRSRSVLTVLFKDLLWTCRAACSVHVKLLTGYFVLPLSIFLCIGLWSAGPAGRYWGDPEAQPGSRRDSTRPAHQHSEHCGRRPPGSAGRVGACARHTRSDPWPSCIGDIIWSLSQCGHVLANSSSKKWTCDHTSAWDELPKIPETKPRFDFGSSTIC